MARTLQDSRTNSRTARAKLPAKAEPYWTVLEQGRALGYRKARSGVGTWIARRYDSQGNPPKRYRSLGAADDLSDGDGLAVLSFAQAQGAAREWFHALAQEEAQKASGGEAVPTGPYTVSEAMRDYFQDGERRGVKGLLRDKHRSEAWIIPLLGQIGVAMLTREQIESWHSGLGDAPRRLRTKKSAKTQAQAAAPKTEDEKRARKDSANRILTTLKAALSHALDRRRVTCSGDAWRAVKPFREVGKVRLRFLSAEDQVRLVNASPAGFRELVQAALFTGGRYSELARLQIRDLNVEAGTLFIAESKSGKPRHVVLTGEAREWFASHAAGREPETILFTREGATRRKRGDLGSTWGQCDQIRFMNEACQSAGLDALTFHELRHTYASALVNAGVPLAFVAAQLGHSDTRMVEKHYGHLAPSALADAIRSLAPYLGIATPAKVATLKIGTGSA